MLAQVTTSANRINRLDNRLANQIAAGEVVERPASVVKELLENAIDAGAARIEVDIERGGTRLIRVTDNGYGIVKEDLKLALCRHATSKISTSDDLASINSLGFRGEALASIASVSRLTLTSRTKDSDFAWQAIAEGREMNVNIQPASATVGTRIEVRDLFYNTPARQKFLRAEKTEFGHVEEIFKRHALANFETAFILKHNHKVVKRIPAGTDKQHYLKRIESICGKPFAENAIPFVCEHEIVKIQGWVGGYHFHRSESDLQYVFINGRPVKDKMLNHAIRQSYQGLLPEGRMPTYVIFLTIDPHKIDVNVHPTKHEVRFDEQRTVHDLLVKSIGDALNEASFPHMESSPNFAGGVDLDTSDSENFKDQNYFSQDSRSSFSDQGSNCRPSNFSYTKTSPNNNFNQASQVRDYGLVNQSAVTQSQVTQSHSSTINQLRLSNGHWIVLSQQAAYIIDEKKWLFGYLQQLVVGEGVSVSKPLLFPQVINLELADLEEFNTLKKLQNLGFVFTPDKENSILLQQVPSWLASIENDVIINLFPKWVKLLAQSEANIRNSDEETASRLKSGLSEICDSLMPLSSKMMDYLLIENKPQLKDSQSVKRLTDGLVQSLFNSEQNLFSADLKRES